MCKNKTENFKPVFPKIFGLKAAKPDGKIHGQDKKYVATANIKSRNIKHGTSTNKNPEKPSGTS